MSFLLSLFEDLHHYHTLNDRPKLIPQLKMEIVLDRFLVGIFSDAHLLIFKAFNIWSRTELISE